MKESNIASLVEKEEAPVGYNNRETKSNMPIVVQCLDLKIEEYLQEIKDYMDIFSRLEKNLYH